MAKIKLSLADLTSINKNIISGATELEKAKSGINSIINESSRYLQVSGVNPGDATEAVTLLFNTLEEQLSYLSTVLQKDIDNWVDYTINVGDDIKVYLERLQENSALNKRYTEGN